MAERVLKQTKERLEEIEIEHRNAFRGEKLASCFPTQMHYYFEKIHSGRHDGNYSKKIDEVGLQMIVDAFNNFKAALDKRGLVYEDGDINYELGEMEYSLLELGYYFKGRGMLTSPKAAAIFCVLCEAQDGRTIDLG